LRDFALPPITRKRDDGSPEALRDITGSLGPGRDLNAATDQLEQELIDAIKK